MKRLYVYVRLTRKKEKNMRKLYLQFVTGGA